MGLSKSLNWGTKIFSDIYQKCQIAASASPNVTHLSSLAWHLLSMKWVWIFLPDFPSPAHIQQMVRPRHSESVAPLSSTDKLALLVPELW